MMEPQSMKEQSLEQQSLEQQSLEPQFDFSVVKMYFHVSPEGAQQPIYELPASRLLEDEPLNELLSFTGRQVHAASLALPASFVGTSLCKLALIQLLFAAQYNRLIDLSLDNLVYQVEPHDDHAHLGYKIVQVRSAVIPSGEREAFLKSHWERFFAQSITPAIEKMADASGLKPDAIWQQFGGQLTYVKEFLAANEAYRPLVEQFAADGRQLAELAPDLFRRRRNPFQHKPRYVENPLNPQEHWLMQSSCCMYDQREHGVKCYTCPRMTPAEREARKQDMLAAAQRQ